MRCQGEIAVWREMLRQYPERLQGQRGSTRGLHRAGLRRVEPQSGERVRRLQQGLHPVFAIVSCEG